MKNYSSLNNSLGDEEKDDSDFDDAVVADIIDDNIQNVVVVAVAHVVDKLELQHL